MKNNNRFKTRQITGIAVLGALASIFMFVEISMPFVPPFLKLDISEIPALIGAFAFGPLCGILIELIKNLIHLTVSSSLGVGEVANFIIGSFFVGTAGYVYKHKKTKTGAIIAMASGTIVMTLIASLANYFFLIPFYAKLYHLSIDDLVGMAAKMNLFVKDFKSMIVYAFVPFNLFKGLVVSIVTAILYKRVSHLFHK